MVNLLHNHCLRGGQGCACANIREEEAEQRKLQGLGERVGLNTGEKNIVGEQRKTDGTQPRLLGGSSLLSYRSTLVLSP